MCQSPQSRNAVRRSRGAASVANSVNCCSAEVTGAALLPGPACLHPERCPGPCNRLQGPGLWVQCLSLTSSGVAGSSAAGARPLRSGTSLISQASTNTIAAAGTTSQNTPVTACVIATKKSSRTSTGRWFTVAGSS